MGRGVNGIRFILLCSLLRDRSVCEISSVRQPKGGSVTINKLSDLLGKGHLI